MLTILERMMMDGAEPEIFMVGKPQWIEMQLFMGKFPQGMSLTEYVRRVPYRRSPKSYSQE